MDNIQDVDGAFCFFLKKKQARNPGMVEKSIANSRGRTDGTDWTDGIDGIEGTDETDGTDGTDGIDGIDGTDGRIATDPMQSLPPGFLALFLIQKTKDPRKSGEHL